MISPWAGDGSAAAPYHPLIWDAYGVAYTDITGQTPAQLLPDPNAYTVEIICDEATLAQIEADNRFVVLWDEEESDAP